jgi:2-polyprenyl-3-methyl-5-hydroxy-6-metoxy-1,4-benzoquinol methylase
MGYTVCECLGCGVLFSDPLPTPAQLTEFYQGFLYKMPDPQKLPALVAERARSLETLLGTSRGAGQRLLDHGGGTGLTFAAAKALGFDTYFNDIDQHAVALVKELHDLDDAHQVGDLDGEAQRFNFIISDNVIEHLPDPIAIIRQLVALLAPSGTLIIKTPWGKANEQLFYPQTVLEYARRAAAYDGALAAVRTLLRAPVWCCDPPRHLFGFTPESIVTAATNAGVPRAWCETAGYTEPLLNKSLIKAYAMPPAGLLGIAKRGLALPLVGPELALKALHFGLRSAGLLTPMGLVLRIRRSAAPA